MNQRQGVRIGAITDGNASPDWTLGARVKMGSSLALADLDVRRSSIAVMRAPNSAFVMPQVKEKPRFQTPKQNQHNVATNIVIIFAVESFNSHGPSERQTTKQTRPAQLTRGRGRAVDLRPLTD